MTRIEHDGVTHYRCPDNPGLTLCGIRADNRTEDLFGKVTVSIWPMSFVRVNCPDCAKVICACRNEPYNTLVAEVEDNTMMRGIYAAVEVDGPVKEEDHVV